MEHNNYITPSYNLTDLQFVRQWKVDSINQIVDRDTAQTCQSWSRITTGFTAYAIYFAYRDFRDFGLGAREIRDGLISGFCDK